MNRLLDLCVEKRKQKKTKFCTYHRSLHLSFSPALVKHHILQHTQGRLGCWRILVYSPRQSCRKKGRKSKWGTICGKSNSNMETAWGGTKLWKIADMLLWKTHFRPKQLKLLFSFDGSSAKSCSSTSVLCLGPGDGPLEMDFNKTRTRRKNREKYKEKVRWTREST